MATFVRPWKRRQPICIIKSNRGLSTPEKISWKSEKTPTFLSDTVNKLRFITIVNNKVRRERVHANYYVT